MVAILGFMALLWIEAPKASAAEYHYCWGSTVEPGTQCDPPYIYDAAWATGAEHSICLQPWYHHEKTKCTSGPGDSVYLEATNPEGEPFAIIPNAKGSTKVYGVGFYYPARHEGGGGGTGGGGETPPPPSWHYVNMGGTFTSDPDICAWSTVPGGHIEITGRGIDNALWHKYWYYAWSAWESMGGTLASAPGCVSWGANRVDIVVRLANNTVQHWYWDGSAWHTDNLGGNITGDPDIASWGTNRLDVVGRAPNGSIVDKFWNGSTWSTWETIAPANSVASGAGVSADGSGGNRLDVVARAPNGSVFHVYDINGTWGTEDFGGVIKGDPDFSSWGPGNYDVWVRDMNDQLEHRWWNGTSWSPWEFAGTSQKLYSSPSAVAVAPGRIDVAGLNSDGSLAYWYWE